MSDDVTRNHRPTHPTRRGVLGGLVGGAALAAFGRVGVGVCVGAGAGVGVGVGLGIGLAPRRARAADAIASTHIADDLHVVTGAGGNVLVRSTSAGQVLVDSGGAAHTEALLAALRALPGERVHTVFNSHWHLDQVGGNATLGAAGAAIVAHEKTRERLSTPYYLVDKERYQEPVPAAGRPAAGLYTTGDSTIGGVRVDYGYLLEAHTDGDIYVRFADRNVIAVGDAVSPERDPVLDWFGGGWLGGRIDSLALLLEISDARTRFVPSYGPVVGRAEVEAEHVMLATVFERMVELMRKGMSPDDIFAAGALDGLSRKIEDPRTFLYSAQKSLWAHYNTLSPDIV